MAKVTRLAATVFLHILEFMSTCFLSMPITLRYNMNIFHSRLDVQRGHNILLRELQAIFIDALKLGPKPNIDGVQPHTIISNTASTIQLVDQGGDVEEDDSCIEWVKGSEGDQWDEFTKVADVIRERWPTTLTKGGTYCQSCYHGAHVHRTVAPNQPLSSIW
jgi:hypothetical protein